MATPQIYYKDGDSWKSALLNSYPVGAIYMSSNSTSPASLFGGAWEQIKDARFWQPNTSYGGTGGESSHTLSTSEMPSHSHEITKGVTLESGSYNIDRLYYAYRDWGKAAWITAMISTGSTGGGNAHNNTPLYRTCFCWRRTS